MIIVTRMRVVCSSRLALAWLLKCHVPKLFFDDQQVFLPLACHQKTGRLGLSLCLIYECETGCFEGESIQVYDTSLCMCAYTIGEPRVGMKVESLTIKEGEGPYPVFFVFTAGSSMWDIVAYPQSTVHLACSLGAIYVCLMSHFRAKLIADTWPTII
jgi:hypothetical protein